MIRKALIWGIGLVMLAAAACGVLVVIAKTGGIEYPEWTYRLTSVPPPSRKVSMISLIADPGRYDGKLIRTIGYLHLAFEGDRLCPSLDIYKVGDAANCIWIDATPQMAPLSDHYVVVEGRFSSSEKGHFGMFSGTLYKVTRAQRWDVG